MDRCLMPYNEEDTKLHLITPALLRAGWTGPRITMEYQEKTRCLNPMR